MPGSDANFWELPFDPGDFDALPDDFFDAPVLTEPARQRARAEALAGIAEMVRTSLTPAAEMEVSQQVVSRQLFGVLRDGRRIGGAIQRLRKLCQANGWDPSGWV